MVKFELKETNGLFFNNYQPKQWVDFKITIYFSNQQLFMSSHQKKQKVEGLDDADYYFTIEGFLVFTASYHLKRGYCCKNGCRHCPFGYKKTEK